MFGYYSQPHATGSPKRRYYRRSDTCNHLYDELQCFLLTHNVYLKLVADWFVVATTTSISTASGIAAVATGVTAVAGLWVVGILHIAAVATGNTLNLLAGAVEAGNLYSRLR